MPDLPTRETSVAVATSRSPLATGLMKLIVQCCATVRSPYELHANANAESASVKIKPPWAISWPLSMASPTVMVSVARPGATSTISIPSPRDAVSADHIASADARASSSGVTISALSPSECDRRESHRARSRDRSDGLAPPSRYLGGPRPTRLLPEHQPGGCARDSS